MDQSPGSSRQASTGSRLESNLEHRVILAGWQLQPLHLWLVGMRTQTALRAVSGIGTAKPGPHAGPLNSFSDPCNRSEQRAAPRRLGTDVIWLVTCAVTCAGG